jgi:hypothetical protein
MVAGRALVGLRHLCCPGFHNGGALIMNQSQNQKKDSMELESLELMGIFLGVFGLIVAAAAIFPDDWIGKIANLVSGGVLLLIGFWAFLKGRSHRK